MRFDNLSLDSLDENIYDDQGPITSRSEFDDYCSDYEARNA